MTCQENPGAPEAAIAAARHIGVAPTDAVAALARFKGVKRRMELRGEAGGVKVYDDFAHHPTAIATTLDGLRRKVGTERIVAVLAEPPPDLPTTVRALYRASQKGVTIDLIVRDSCRLRPGLPGVSESVRVVSVAHAGLLSQIEIYLVAVPGVVCDETKAATLAAMASSIARGPCPP